MIRKATRADRPRISEIRFAVRENPPSNPALIEPLVDWLSNCNGCQRKFAQMVGANWAAWGTVQKVNNLILNINVYMEIR